MRTVTRLLLIFWAIAVRGIAAFPGDGAEQLLSKENEGKWKVVTGDWKIENNVLTGDGESETAFEETFVPPFIIQFKINVIHGKRPRVRFGPYEFCNAGEDEFGLGPKVGGDLLHFERKTEYKVIIRVDSKSVDLSIDDKPIASAAGIKDKIDRISFSAGGKVYKGRAEFSEITVTKATAESVGLPRVLAPKPPAAEAEPKSLEEAITSFSWAWKPTRPGHRERVDNARFYRGGSLTISRSEGRWEIAAPDTLTLYELKNGRKTSMVFNKDFTHFNGVDFDGKATVEGTRLGPVDPNSTPPAPTASKSSVPPTPNATPTPASALIASAADFVHDYSGSLIVVKGDEGSGSGFVCSDGKLTLLYTNIHVVADLSRPRFTRLDGTAAVIGGADVAKGRDIARLETKNPPARPLEVITNFEDNVRIGDQVLVPGNSGGGGVVTAITGSIAGIGPDRIEVSAEFIPGNSGSPIIHVKTGKVIGIATYLTVRREDPAKPYATTTRRFGYRIDNVPAWEGMDWNLFRQDAVRVKQVSDLTDDVVNFLDALERKKTPEFATETLRRPAADWMKTMKERLSGTDRRNATESFLRALRMMMLSDVSAAQRSVRYTYFREELDDFRKTRESLADGFDKALK